MPNNEEELSDSDDMREWMREEVLQNPSPEVSSIDDPPKETASGGENLTLNFTSPDSAHAFNSHEDPRSTVRLHQKNAKSALLLSLPRQWHSWCEKLAKNGAKRRAEGIQTSRKQGRAVFKKC